MKPVCRHIRLQGLGAEKQLTYLQQQGYTLYDIKRINLRTIEFGFLQKESASILTYLTERGFTCDPLPIRGTARKLQSLINQTPLLCFILCAVFAVSLSMRFVWRIDINGAGAYIGEVRAFLKENNLHAGRAIASIDLKTVKDALTHRLPRVAWVHTSIQGMTLRIDVIQGVPAPPIETDGANGSVVARCDGIIQSIAVYAGTAAVKPGDTVRTGDILIHGYERGTNEQMMPVHARGSVTACTYIKSTAAVSAEAFSMQRTGRSAEISVLHLPFLQLPLNSSPDYLTSEYESHFLPLGGAWLPLQMEKRTLFELYFEEDFPDETALRSEAARLSLQKLLLKCAKNDEIIDKWLYYSMIEGGILSATVTAQVLTEIGLFSPETPE